VARILLVDDDKDIRDLGCAILANAGHDAFAVEGAVLALEFLRSYSVDVIITDANMPQHSGFDLLRTLQRDPQYTRGASLVMLTGRRERKDIERAVELGVHDYIVKPLDPMLFIQKVNDLLARRPAEDRPQVDFASSKIGTSAKALSVVDLVSLSEVGIVIRSEHRFREGSRIDLETDLFTKIDVPRPLFRVLSAVAVKSNAKRAAKPDLWEVRLAFVGVDERTLTKIRAWIHGNTTRNRSAA
jgi:DNA-binding response OmpR family regulator